MNIDVQELHNENINKISYPFIFTIKKDSSHNRIDIISKKGFPSNWESLGFEQRINETKNKIEELSPDEWNKIRKIINPFDFPNIFNSKLKIFNRSFYKFWEIFHQFDLDYDCHKYKSLHIAEAPGSFIHTLLFKNSFVPKNKEENKDEDGFTIVKNKKRNKKEKYIDTISFKKDGYPKYNEQIINSPYVNFLKIGNDDGNILEKDNLSHLLSLGNIYQLITADGGIDEKGYYDSKEQIHLKLFLGQILIALNTQKENGDFVLKIYDIFTLPMIDLIFLLSQFYDIVYIYKPLTSRITNSEKYLICKNYKGASINTQRITKQVLEFLDNIIDDSIQIINFEIRPKPSQEFKDQFKNINNKILTIQNESIKKALDLINKPIDKNFLEEQNILKAKNFIKWKNKYNLSKYID